MSTRSSFKESGSFPGPLDDRRRAFRALCTRPPMPSPVSLEALHACLSDNSDLVESLLADGHTHMWPGDGALEPLVEALQAVGLLAWAAPPQVSESTPPSLVAAAAVHPEVNGSPSVTPSDIIDQDVPQPTSSTEGEQAAPPLAVLGASQQPAQHQHQHQPPPQSSTTAPLPPPHQQSASPPLQSPPQHQLQSPAPVSTQPAPHQQGGSTSTSVGPCSSTTAAWLATGLSSLPLATSVVVPRTVNGSPTAPPLDIIDPDVPQLPSSTVGEQAAPPASASVVPTGTTPSHPAAPAPQQQPLHQPPPQQQHAAETRPRWLHLDPPGPSTSTRSQRCSAPAARCAASSAPSSGSSAPSAGPPVEGERGVPLDRLLRAYHAGLAARRKMDGESRIVPPTPECKLKNRCYVVLRSRAGTGTFSRWYSVAAGLGAAELVQDDGGHLWAGAVFHGWPSLVEAWWYARGAGMPLPPRVD